LCASVGTIKSVLIVTFYQLKLRHELSCSLTWITATSLR